MKDSEIRELIKSSADPDWFKTIEVNLEYKIIPYTEKKLKGFHAIYKYFMRQQKAWKEYESIPSEFNTSKNQVNQVLQSLERFINSVKDKNENWLNSQWN